MSSITSKILVFAAALFFFSSCKEKGDSNAEKTQISEKQVVNDSKAHIGAWIKEAYAKAVTQNLSPFLSQQELEGITELKIDSAEILVVIDNLEAQKFPYKKHGDSLVLENGKSYLISKNSLKLPNGNKMLKISDEIPNESVLNYFVMRELMAGVYESSLNETDNTIKFTADGKMAGWTGYTKYKVHTTFAELGAMDIIEFTSTTGQKDFFAWQMQDQNIVLFELEPGEEYLFKKGKEKGKLIRKGELNI